MDEIETEGSLSIVPVKKHNRALVKFGALSQTFDKTYIHAATSPNTRKAYRQDIQHFMAWGGLLPATTASIVNYLHAFAPSLNPRTLSRRLTALKHWHVYQDFPDPTQHPLIRKTLAGIQHVHGKPKQKSQPLTIKQLQQIILMLKKSGDNLTALRNSALIQVGFFGALRRSEIANLRYEDFHFVEEGMEILIPRSKGDQQGEGQICALPYGDDLLCPVNAVKTWCLKAHITSGHLFRAINRHDQLSGRALSADGVNFIIKKLTSDAGLPKADEFSGHSLRRGFATETSKKGAPFITIMRHGRWKNEKTVLGYIEEGKRFEQNPASHLFKK